MHNPVIFFPFSYVKSKIKYKIKQSSWKSLVEASSCQTKTFVKVDIS